MNSISRLSKGHYMKGGVVFLLVVALIVGMAACIKVTPPPSGLEEIWDWEDLSGIREKMHGNYILMANLDSISQGWDLVNGGDGWEPIGSFPNPPFSGRFDGNGFEIEGLYINRPDDDNVGLFGYVGQGGVVTNVTLLVAEVKGRESVGAVVGHNRGTLANSSSTGSVNGTQWVGGLVGYTWQGTVHHSESSAEVYSSSDLAGGLVGFNSLGGKLLFSYYKGSLVRGRTQVGGLVGLNNGLVGWSNQASATCTVEGTGNLVGGAVGLNHGTVQESFNFGQVVCGNGDTGGLVGSNGLTGLVINCGNGADVTVNCGTVSHTLSADAPPDGDYVGGLVGWNEGMVSNSYSTGSVTGVGYVGGLVGGNDGDVGSCFSTGMVTGDQYFGGLVGSNNGTVADSFWDTEASGTTTGIGTGTGEATGITGVPSATLKAINTYRQLGWDICAVARGEVNTACTWNIVDGEGYPFLSGKESEPAPEPQKVTIAAIPGVTAPATGATPRTTTAPTTQYTGTISWSPAHSPYQAETVYTATITLTAREGYTFAGVAADLFTVAGATRTSNAANSGVVTAVFPATVMRKHTPMVAAGGYHTVGLKSDGTVVAVGRNIDGPCEVGGWTGIVQLAAGGLHTVGLKSDGTAVAVGYNEHGPCEVGGWTGIVQVAAGWHHTVGLKADGTVVPVGLSVYGQCEVSGWTGIVQLAAGGLHTVGLRADGTVVAVGWNGDGQCDVGGWTGVVQVAAGHEHTVGLRADGTVVAVGWNRDGQCEVGGWTNVVQVAAGGLHTVGLKSDGTAVAVGYNEHGPCDVGDWTGIVQVAAGYVHTVGLRSDRTVVGVGDNEFGQCDVGGWNLAA